LLKTVAVFEKVQGVLPDASMEVRSAFSFLPFWIEDAKLENNMLGRHLLFGLVALALAAFISQPVFADRTHEGKVIKAGDDKLTMTDKDGTNTPMWWGRP
jgi:hypothetical protein